MTTYRGMDKLTWCMELRKEYYLAIKSNETMPLEITTLGEVTQKEKDKYYMILLTCGI